MSDSGGDSASSSHTESRINPSEPQQIDVQLGMDYGTSSIKMAYTCRYPNDNTETNIKIMEFPLGGFTLPSHVGWVGRRFLFGHDLSNAVKNNLVPPRDVIECSKLAIHFESMDTAASRLAARTPVVVKVLEQLHRAQRSLQELLNEHMQGIIALAKQVIKADKNYQLRLGKEKDVTIAISLRLSVPQLWNHKANAMMHAAAESAGIIAKELAHEPQCALAASMMIADSTANNPLRQLKANNYIMVYDLGCGTGDAVLCKLKDDLEGDSKSRMHVVGQAPGTTFCSQHVNEGLLSSVMEDWSKDDQAEAKHFLQFREDDFQWHLAESIETAKRSDPQNYYNLVLNRGSDGQPRIRTINQATMRAEYDKVIDGIMTMGDSVLKNKKLLPKSKKLDAVLLLGGFSESKFVQKRFEDKYASDKTVVFAPSSMGVNIVINECRVAFGSLSKRYGDIKPRELPRQDTYAFIQDEQQGQDPDEHDDCREPAGQHKLSSGEDAIRTYYPHMMRIVNGVPLVPDRVIKVLSSTDTMVGGRVKNGGRTEYNSSFHSKVFSTHRCWRPD